GSPAADGAVVFGVPGAGAVDAATTDENGRFEIPAEPGVTVDATFFQNVSDDGPQLPRDGVPDFALVGDGQYTLDSSVDVTEALPAANRLQIQVVDDTGTPVGDREVNVSVAPRHDGSADDGLGAGFQFQELEDGAVVTPAGEPGVELVGPVAIRVTPRGDRTRFGDASVTRNVTVDENETVTLTLPTESRPPTARLTLNRSNVLVDEAVRLNGTTSSDNVGIADGRVTVGGPDGERTFRRPVAAFTPTAPGTYEVTLNVTDPAGNRDETTRTVTVRQRADVSYDFELSGFVAGQVPPNENLTVTATASNDGAATVERTVALRVDG
ncbi:MAG: hypothetical protein J07HB67_00430, partial [halophilic archaeon J07HB67]